MKTTLISVFALALLLSFSCKTPPPVAPQNVDSAAVLAAVELRTSSSSGEVAMKPPRDGGRFDPEQKGPMKIGEEYTARYWRPAYLSALQHLHNVRQSCDGGPIAVQDAAHRWLMHHSLLDASHGDAVILGASTVKQFRMCKSCLQIRPMVDR